MFYARVTHKFCLYFYNGATGSAKDHSVMHYLGPLHAETSHGPVMCIHGDSNASMVLPMHPWLLQYILGDSNASMVLPMHPW